MQPANGATIPLTMIPGFSACALHPPHFRPINTGMAHRMPAMNIVHWRALALKRLAHLDDLKRSGRWQRHFANEEALDKAISEAAADAEKWKQLAYVSDTPSREAAE